MSSLDLPFGKGIPLKIIIVGILLAMCLLSNVVSAGIVYQTYNISQSDRTPNISLPMPSGVAQNDLLLAQITYNVGNVVSTTGPSDWTLLIRTNNGANSWDGQYIGQAIYYKVANASESGPYVWNINWGPVNGHSQTAIGGVMRFSGVDPATPIFGYSGGIGNSSNLTAPGINNVPANSMLVACFGLDSSISSFAVPTNMTWIYRDVFKRFGTTPVTPSFAAAWELYGPGGTTGVRYSSNSFSGAPWVAHLVALQPDSGNCTAPSITTQPVNLTRCVGSSAMFTVTATGSGTLSYQWYHGSTPVGTNSNSLVINPVAVIDGGNYTVNVSNSCGYVVSRPATLTVNTPPSLTTQPVNLTQCAGSSAMFTVTATGSGTLSYQWYHGSTPVGTNSNSLVINPVRASDAGNYYVVVTSTGCTPATSDTATLTLKTVCISGYKNSTYHYGLPGWTISLNGTTIDGVIVPQKTTTTNATGYYQFCGLDPGTYTLREQLQATEWTQILAPGVVNLGCDNITNQNFTNKPINSNCTSKPYVKYKYKPLSSPAHTIQFTDTSTGPFAVQWNWKFGDGTPNSYEENPKHTYARAGVYTVTLGIKWVDCSGTVVSSTWKTTSKTITVP